MSSEQEKEIPPEIAKEIPLEKEETAPSEREKEVISEQPETDTPSEPATEIPSEPEKNEIDHSTILTSELTGVEEYTKYVDIEELRDDPFIPGYFKYNRLYLNVVITDAKEKTTKIVENIKYENSKYSLIEELTKEKLEESLKAKHAQYDGSLTVQAYIEDKEASKLIYLGTILFQNSKFGEFKYSDQIFLLNNISKAQFGLGSFTHRMDKTGHVYAVLLPALKI